MAKREDDTSMRDTIYINIILNYSLIYLIHLWTDGPLWRVVLLSPYIFDIIPPWFEVSVPREPGKNTKTFNLCRLWHVHVVTFVFFLRAVDIITGVCIFVILRKSLLHFVHTPRTPVWRPFFNKLTTKNNRKY